MGQRLLDLINLEGTIEQGNERIEKIRGNDIAIIGISAKLPLADTLDEFWEILKTGKDCIRDIPQSRRTDVDDYLHFTGNKLENMEYEQAAYLDEIDSFDCNFFKISPKEASLMDPNQRLFLQTVWAAIEDSGYGGQKLVGTKTGVYVGFCNDSGDYKKFISEIEPSSLMMSVPGNLPPMIASRISYLLDLRGPNMIVNTVCSSSLIAVHLACQSIRNGECDMAIAGGIQIYLLPVRQVELGIESSDGRTKTFDDRSDGTGGGEGVAAIILKPLGKAIKDRDNIYAVIKGDAVNQDGASIGISAPNPSAQEEVIVSAWRNAEIDPETISYIEAHGTGTKLGDPIEIEGIQKAFRRYTEKRQFCAVGSVKSNIGHLDASAGIVGLIKAVLALKYRMIPPIVHFNKPNRKIRFLKSPVYVNDELLDWSTGDEPRRCGVSSFGFSGTNCHIVLEEYTGYIEEYLSLKETRQIHTEKSQVLTLSAKTKDGLKELVKQYIKLLEKENDFQISDICYTANTGRGHYNFRLAIVARDRKEFLDKLQDLAMSNLGDIKESCIFIGEHRVITSICAEKQEGDITQDEIRVLCKKVRESINMYLASEKQDKTSLFDICKLYRMGAEVEWDSIYIGEKVRKVSLPTYPFERKRCWLQLPTSEDSLQDEVPLYYTTSWKPCSLKTRINNENMETVLILKDSFGKAEKIVCSLRAEGRNVIEVETGSEFKRESDNRYTIPINKFGFKKLFDDINQYSSLQVVHMLTVANQAAGSLDELEGMLEKGLYSLFHLVSCMLENDFKEADIALISEYASSVNGSENRIMPENAAMFGLGRVVSMENFHLKCRCIDIDEHTEYDKLTLEIKSGYQDYNVAYRNGRRYIEEFCEIEDSDGSERELDIKSDGIYIITGGTGGMGLEVARYMALKSKINLALINRSKFPPREEWDAILEDGSDKGLCAKIKVLKEIEEAGGHVLCCSADVSNEEETSRILDYLRASFGRINGIVHCAGIGVGMKGAILKNENEDTFKKVISPKVQGTWLLNNLTKEDKLDFFIVFSSPITLVGGIGSGSYTSANSYLNSFAAYRSGLGKKTLAMSWAPWEKTMEMTGAIYNGDKQMFEILHTSELIKGFEEVMTKEFSDACMVIIGRLNYKSKIFYMQDYLPFRLSREINFKLKSLKGIKHYDRKGLPSLKYSDVNLKGRKNGGYSETERKVAEIFSRILGYNEISIYDNFYELGGDSILAVKIINCISEEMKLDVKLTDLLKNLTLIEFSKYIDNKYLSFSKADNKYLQIPTATEKDYYGVSPAQKRLIVINQIQGANISWNMSWAMILEGDLNKERLEKVFRELVNRHEALRTSFEFVGGEFVQKIHKEIDFEINFSISKENKTDEIIDEFIRPFDLGNPPLFRVGLVKFNENRHLLLFDIHHIISDASSMEVLVREVVLLYSGDPLPKPKVQYKDYSDWQLSRIKTDAIKKQEEYWLSVFSGEIPVLKLPTDYPRPVVQLFEGDKITFYLERELTGELNKVALETETSLYMVLMAVYNVLLSLSSNQEDIIVGMPVAGRLHADLEGLIGMFINVIALRSYPKGDKTFRNFLTEVKTSMLEAYDNQEYPFMELVNKLDINRDLSRNPLFDASFVMQNTGSAKIEMGENIKFISYKHDNKTSRNDLHLEALEDNNRIQFILEYSTRLFRKEAIEGLIKNFIEIMKKVVKQPDILLSDIELLSMNERQSILNEFNDDLENE